ncbi:MAG: ABC transporter substrate-binding protein [Candidatus Eisenbacteria bacterium]|nr:ABC transporter substrate-binding protein [Candidatus Eisenbacteria bacterium]
MLPTPSTWRGGVAGALLLLPPLLLLCGPAGCGRRQQTIAESPPPLPGGTVRVLSEPIEEFDPIAVDEVYESVVLRQIYEGLVRFDPNLRIHPSLATSWTISPDGLIYTFRIRTDALFHDGRPLRVEDVAFSLRRAIRGNDGDPGVAGSYLRGILGASPFAQGRSEDLAGLRILDERTLEIELERPLSILLKVLAMDQAAIVRAPEAMAAADAATPSAEALAAASAEAPAATPAAHPAADPGAAPAIVGTGPFHLVREEEGGRLVLARNERYWGEPALIDTLVFVPAPSLGVEAGRAILEGWVDFASVGRDEIHLLQTAGYPVYRFPELSFAFLGLRNDLPPFDIPQVRRAVLLSIDREALRRLNPEAIVPVSGLLPSGISGRDPIDRMPRLDRGEAMRLLEQAGYPGGRGLPKIVLGSSTGGSSIRTAEAVRGDLQSVGFDVEIRPLRWRALDSLATGGALHGFFMTWVADIPDPDSFLYALFHSTGDGNLFRYRSALVDSLLEAGRELPAGAPRSDLYLRIQEGILRDAPMVPLFQSLEAYSWRPEIQGVDIGPCGFSLVPFSRVHLRQAPQEREGLSAAREESEP